jgi:hypothetical protein
MGRLWTRDGEHGAATPRIEFVWKRYERAVELKSMGLTNDAIRIQLGRDGWGNLTAERVRQIIAAGGTQ